MVVAARRNEDRLCRAMSVPDSSIANGSARRFPGAMLDGLWTPQGAEFSGESIPVPSNHLLIEGDHYIVTTGSVKDRGRLRIDTTVTPHTIDLVATAGPHRGQVIEGVFRVRGNLLQMCYCVGDPELPRPRPEQLSSPPGSMQLLFRYRRETQLG